MKLSNNLLVMAFILSPAYAQKKTAQTQKAVAKADATVPAAPGVEPKKSESQSAFKASALLWGGYNIPSSDYFLQATSGLTKGGLAGGVEFTAGTDLVRAGVATSYIPIYTFESGNVTDTKTLMPFEGVLNICLFGFYAGGRGGYVVDIGSTTSTSTPYQKTNGTTFGGQVGYQYAIGPVAIDVGAIMSFAHTEAKAFGGKAGAHADYTNILPRIGIYYTF